MSKTYIPLGNSCSIAYNLKLHNLRKLAFPFDWVRVTNFNKDYIVNSADFEHLTLIPGK